ncbi:MAG: DUF2975 domain-containing protein [Oceanicaulis sp.]|nr:DUF2975 domain-containing protein [Oceanicaulis sp.]
MKIRWDSMLYVVSLLSLALLIIHAGRAWVEFLAEGPLGADGALGYLNAGLTGLVHIMPFLFLIPGLVALVRLGGHYRRGEVFTRRNAGLIEQFGSALVLAAGAFVIFRPTLLDWIGGVDRGFAVQLNEAPVALFCAGVFVFVMSRVMGDAVTLKEDSDSIV